jgi:hypothetical protein
VLDAAVAVHQVAVDPVQIVHQFAGVRIGVAEMLRCAKQLKVKARATCTVYDACAEAFAVIHNNLKAAMRAANITGETGTLNAQAESAARSAFESAKQRFFVIF